MSMKYRNSATIQECFPNQKIGCFGHPEVSIRSSEEKVAFSPDYKHFKVAVNKKCSIFLVSAGLRDNHHPAELHVQQFLHGGDE